MEVYTYYDNTVGQSSQEELIDLWRKSWRMYGWSPIVLRPADAQKHRAYNEFKTKIASFPTTNSRAYEEACYMRWLALAAYKRRGWMTDYDVINRGFRTRQPLWPVEMLDKTYVPCAVGTLERGPDRIIDMIFEFDAAGLQHVSDMIIFKTRFDSQAFGYPGNAVEEFGCDGWSRAPLVHFAAGKAGQNKAEIVAQQFPCLKTQIRKP